MADQNSTFNQTAFLTPTHIAATFLFTFFTLISIFVYVFVLFILFYYYRDLKSNFYSLVISLGFSDLIYLFLVLFYCVPCTILQRQLWGSYDHWAGFLQCVGYFGQCLHLTVIAINRFCYSNVETNSSKKLDAIFYSKKALACWIVLIWLMSILISIPLKFVGCPLIYDYVSLNFAPDCDRRVSGPLIDRITILDATLAYIFPFTITLLHVFTWVVVYFRGRRAGSIQDQQANQGERDRLRQQKNRERRILIQFTLISFFLVLWQISFWVIPYALPKSSGALVITLLGIASVAVNPFTYLKFNKLINFKARYIIFVIILKKDANGGWVSENRVAPSGGDQTRPTYN